MDRKVWETQGVRLVSARKKGTPGYYLTTLPGLAKTDETIPHTDKCCISLDWPRGMHNFSQPAFILSNWPGKAIRKCKNLFRQCIYMLIYVVTLPMANGCGAIWAPIKPQEIHQSSEVIDVSAMVVLTRCIWNTGGG